MSFQNPIVVEGASESIVRNIESAVIIPGDTHEKLWVHPELVTVPGNPIEIELRAVTTDRRGRDRHRTWHYFHSDIESLQLRPINKPTAPAWERKNLDVGDLEAPRSDSLELPERLGHTWASAYVYLDEKTALQAFTTSVDPTSGHSVRGRHSVQSLLAEIENDKIIPLHRSNAWTNDQGRGLYEPHIAGFRGRYYMTARAEDGRGYVMVSDDKGYSWSEPTPWKWEDGEEIPMDQTMTKLLAHSDGMVLVYTRIREDNTDTFRHRTPLHIADFDPETLTLQRDTERIIVPNRSTGTGLGSLPLGNFWVWPINQHKSYVVVGEWRRDGHPENGDIWLSKIYWRQPNQKMTPEGHERIARPDKAAENR